MIARLRLVALITSLLLAFTPSAWAEQAEDPKGVKVKLDTKGFRVQTNDESFEFKMGGRLHVDVAGHPGHLPLVDPTPPGPPFFLADPVDGIEVRRGRLYLGATILSDWEFFFNVDFADDEVAVKDLLVSFNGFSWGRFAIGNQKQPFSESLEMSSNDLPFVERGVDNDLIVPFVDRAIGGRFDGNGKHWHAAVGVYGDGIDPTEALDEGWGLAARGVFTPILEKDKIVHIGFRTAYREPAEDQAGTVQVRTETTHFSNLYISDTGSVTDTRKVVLYGPEAAFVWGRFSLFGEYNRAWWEMGSMPNLDFQSGHVAFTWSLTGESRAAVYSMKSSEFKRLTPKHDFSLKQGTWGALELATRYAYIDVSDQNVAGGEEGRVSTALNWYLNPIIRMMLDWTRVTNAKQGSITTNTAEGTDILTFRFQLQY